MDKMSAAEQFFYDHAGYSYRPETETRRQGRRRSARRLAEAEAYAKEHGWSVNWADDWDVDHRKEFDCYDNGGPSTCESAVLRDADDHILGSLGCIDDADKNYRRVIEAELALEAMHNEQQCQRAMAM